MPGVGQGIWLRHDLETFKKRLSSIEQKVAKNERASHPDEVETAHTGKRLSSHTLICICETICRGIFCYSG
ncbi:MAG: hypothetical protein ACUZ8H_07495 [Candidatus Anammoxibacter sp.]